MSRNKIDFAKVEPHQQAVHERLCNWAAWVTPSNRYGSTSPMFRLYRSNSRQWHAPQYRETCDVQDAKLVEHTMRYLPYAHREALVWAYIVKCTPAVACKHLATSYDGLYRYLHDGRQMIGNIAGRMAA